MSVSPARQRLPNPLRDAAFWLLTGGTFAFFAWPLLAGRTYFFRDLYFWSFPQRERLSELVHAGTLPLWDSLVYGGQPLLGNVQYFVLYPTSLLALVLPAVTAVNLEIALHFALCAAASYALARAIGMPTASSALAGVVFTFAGVTLSYGNLLGRLLATPHTALLLLFWHRFLAERRRQWFALAAAAGALQVFAASAEQVAFSTLLAAAWGIVYPYPASSGPRSRRLLFAAALAAAVIGLTAVQTLPMVELVRHSWRGAGMASFERGMWSVDPRRLPELLVPGFFGDTDTLRETDYWGAAVEDQGFPMLLSIYFGVTVLVLALTGTFSRTDGPLPRGVARLLGGVLFGAMLFSLGRFLPTGGLFDPTLLLGGVFRYPVKFFFAAPLPAGLLAAQGAEAAWRCARTRRRLAAALGSAALLLALFAAGLRWDAPFGDTFARLFFRRNGIAGLEPLAGRLLHAALFAGTAAALLLLGRASAARAAPALLCGLVALDLSTAGRRLNPTAPRELLTRVPPLAEAVRRGVGSGRFYRDRNPRDLALSAPSNRIRWRYQWNRETLAFYTAAGFGIPSILQISADGLDLARHERLTETFLRLPWERRIPILSAASVRLFLTADAVAAEGIERVAEVPNASNRTFSLYRNTRAARRAELVHFWRAAASPEQAIRAMLVPGFDPRRHAVIEGGTPPPPRGPCPAPLVLTVSFSPNLQRWKTRSSCAGYLVLSEPFAPGWRASVDGRTVALLPANGLFSAVYLPPGEHEVTRAYRPLSLLAGAVISAATLAALLAWALRAAGVEEPLARKARI